jgi:hypothetical protein
MCYSKPQAISVTESNDLALRTAAPLLKVIKKLTPYRNDYEKEGGFSSPVAISSAESYRFQLILLFSQSY